MSNKKRVAFKPTPFKFTPPAKRDRRTMMLGQDVRLTSNGLPVRVQDWTVDDWRDLWDGTQEIIGKISKRYVPRPQPEPTATDPNDFTP